MITFIVIIGAIGSVLLAGYYSGIETAAYSASQVRLRLQAVGGEPRARRCLALLNRLAALITTTLIGHNLAVYIGTYIVTTHLEESGKHNAEVIATFILLPFFFIFAETLPKRIAHSRANDFILQAVAVLDISRILFYPLGAILGSIASILNRILDQLGIMPQKITGRSRLAESLEAGMAEGLLSEDQHKMAQRIMELEALTVADVMVPTQGSFSLLESTPCRVAAVKILQSNHHRALLTDNAGRFTGKLITLNTLIRSDEAAEEAVVNYALEAPAFAVKTPLVKALRKMREDSIRVGIAVSQSGTPIGLISINRILGRVVAGMRL